MVACEFVDLIQLKRRISEQRSKDFHVGESIIKLTVSRQNCQVNLSTSE